jgi:hypothetical protein
MDALRKAAEQALEALRYIYTETTPEENALIHAAILDLYAALFEQKQEQEPVAWYLPQDGFDSLFRDHSTVVACDGNKWEGWLPLYTHPPRREQDDAEITALRAEVERLREALQRIADFTLLEFEGPHHMALVCVETARAALDKKETT